MSTIKDRWGKYDREVLAQMGQQDQVFIDALEKTYYAGAGAVLDLLYGAIIMKELPRVLHDLAKEHQEYMLDVIKRYGQ